jgi:serine/threonine protein kinase
MTIMDQMTYPCSFEKAAQKSLEKMIQELEPEPIRWSKNKELAPGSIRKVRTLCGDAINGKVKLVESARKSTKECFVVKQFPKAAALASSKLECPRNEIYASLDISQRLDVPNTAKILFAAQDEHYFYLASEHCPHGELFTHLNMRSRLNDEAELREVAHEILEHVSALNRAGVAHRDLSLENVLIAADGGLRVIDFAQAIRVHAPGDTAGEVRVTQDERGPPGKCVYRGPELATGEPYLATKVDAFAIGVMLYMLVVGDYLFSEEDRFKLFPAEEMNQGRCRLLCEHMQKANKRVAERVPPGCLDLMEQLLAPNPELRLSAEEALMHPWLTGAVSGLWDAADDKEDMEDVSTSYSGDSETSCSGSASSGNNSAD